MTKETLVKILNHNYFNNKISKCIKLNLQSTSDNYIIYVEGKKYFIKIHSNVQLEAYNLGQLNNTNHECYKLPQVIFLDSVNNILVLEYEDGNVLLNDLIIYGNILSFYFCKRKLTEKLSRSGEWLACYHNENVVDDEFLISNDIENAISKQNYLETIKNIDKEGLQSYLNNYKNIKLPSIKSGNDFTSRNIIISDSSIAVIDWEQLLLKPIYYNIIYFITNLYSRSRYPLFSFSIQGILMKEFIEGYIKYSKFHIDHEYFKLYSVIYYIDYIYDYEKLEGVFESWLNHTYTMNRFINNKVKAMLVDCIKS